MLTLPVGCVIWALSLFLSTDCLAATDNLNSFSPKTKRGIVKQEHEITEKDEFYQPKGYTPSTSVTLLLPNDNLKASSYYTKSPVKNVQHTSQSYEVHPHATSYKGSGEHSFPYTALLTPNHQFESNENAKVKTYTAPHLETPFTVVDDYKLSHDIRKSPEVAATIKKPQGLNSHFSNTFNKAKDNGKQTNLKDFEYSSHRTPIFLIPSQIAKNKASSSNVQVPVYKTNYPVSKGASYSSVYAPALQTASNSAPGFLSSSKLSQNNPYRQGKATDIKSKDGSLPVLQLQTSQDQSEYLNPFERQPLVLSTGLDYQTVPNIGYNFGGEGIKPNAVLQSTAPFSSPLSSFQGQVVPIQKSSSTPQFPQYKGASIEIYPAAPTLSNAPAAYASLHTQPQLHFRTVAQPIQSVNAKSAISLSAPAEKIRSDVEVINKKKPTLPPPTEDHTDDDEIDEGYKSIEKEYGENSQKDDNYDYHLQQGFKEPASESDFKPSKSFPFKSYDELFGKYSKASYHEDTEGKPFSKEPSYSSSNNDNDNEDYTLSKFHLERTSSKPTYSKYEDDTEEEEEEEEEESKTIERRQKVQENPSYVYKSKSYKYSKFV